jgi:hypothetical protein
MSDLTLSLGRRNGLSGTRLSADGQIKIPNQLLCENVHGIG